MREGEKERERKREKERETWMRERGRDGKTVCSPRAAGESDLPLALVNSMTTSQQSTLKKMSEIERTQCICQTFQECG